MRERGKKLSDAEIAREVSSAASHMSQEVCDLYQSDLKAGLTVMEAGLYTKKDYPLEKMKLFSECYRAGYDDSFINILYKDNLSTAMMHVLIEAHKKGVPDEMIRNVADAETSIEGAKRALSHVYDQQAAVGAIIESTPEHEQELIQQMQKVVECFQPKKLQNFLRESMKVVADKDQRFGDSFDAVIKEKEEKIVEITKERDNLKKQLQSKEKELSEANVAKADAENQASKNQDKLNEMKAKTVNDSKYEKEAERLSRENERLAKDIENLRKSLEEARNVAKGRDTSSGKEKTALVIENGIIEDSSKSQTQETVIYGKVETKERHYEDVPIMVKLPEHYEIPVRNSSGELTNISVDRQKRKASGLLGYISRYLSKGKNHNFIQELQGKGLNEHQLIEIINGIKQGLSDNQISDLINSKFSAPEMAQVVRIAVLSRQYE